ncbi:MAG TPA: squalene/phytoene synthase family protein [Anaerolineales bacterium]|nr:squalene/phytoene synthase family protein [Anaerolineales bacterium]
MTMQQNTLPWEASLLRMAHEAFDRSSTPAVSSLDSNLLSKAYQACEKVTRQHSRTFYLASGLLPYQKRRAVRALYAFCRVSDDIVDRNLSADPLPALNAWRSRSLSQPPTNEDLVTLAWADTRFEYGIPVRYAEQLLDGVASDLTRCRYRTFEELAGYAYRVASTVGLMAMHIVGFSGPEAIPYAIKLGVALQITNILRDVAEDWRNGHLYLPLEDLERFGLTEGDIAAGKVTPRWRRFMRFQIERVRRLYAEAWPGIALLESDGRFAIAAAADLYEAILGDIEDHDYDVFTRRAHLNAPGKLRRLPGIGFRALALADTTVWFD